MNEVQPNFELFEKLEQTSSKKEKVSLLKSANEADKILLKLALDPDIVFHIQKIEYSGGTVDITPPMSIVDVCNLLSSKKALKNEDREFVAVWLNSQHEQARKWYERVILKDLRSGFDVSTVNKAFPGLIVTYDCALADEYDWEKDEHRLANSTVDVKLDGVRCLAKVETVPGQTTKAVTLRSRKGKLITTFPQIEKELALLPDNVYDGEIYLHGENAFQTLMKYVRNDRNAPDDLNYRFCIFDIVSSEPYHVRVSNLWSILCQADLQPNSHHNAHYPTIWYFGKRLGHPVQHNVNNNQELMELLDTLLDCGFEGLMVKDKHASYKAKRSKNILKVKRFHSAEGEVIGWEYGVGRLKDTMGALTLQMPNGNTFKVGSGYDDNTRHKLLAECLTLEIMGRIVEYRYQELTKDGIPRFPTFLRFRSDLELGM